MRHGATMATRFEAPRATPGWALGIALLGASGCARAWAQSSPNAKDGSAPVDAAVPDAIAPQHARSAVGGRGYGEGPRCWCPRVQGPRVRLAPSDVRGSLPREVVRRVIVRNLGQVEHCYEQGLAANPTAAGRVVVSFVVNASGDVMVSQEASNDVTPRSVGECIAHAVRRWQFPSLAPGTLCAITTPFVLTPEDPEDRRPRHVPTCGLCPR
jgi:hypothetical protein